MQVDRIYRRGVVLVLHMGRMNAAVIRGVWTLVLEGRKVGGSGKGGPPISMPMDPMLLATGVVGALVGPGKLRRDEAPKMRTVRRVTRLLLITVRGLIVTGTGLGLFAEFVASTLGQILKQPNGTLWWAVGLLTLAC